MNTKKHYEFTLWIHSEDLDDEKVPALIFAEATSFDEISLTMLTIVKLGLHCSLTCDTWTEVCKDESEDVKND